MNRSATFSYDGVYRHTLTRRWGSNSLLVHWVMLNPSTADGEEDDPTIRKCIGFTKLMGFSGLIVTNLFDYRATDPKELRKTVLPSSPQNWYTILSNVKECHVTVIAWGNHGTLSNRDEGILEMMSKHKKKIFCLGLNINGTPRHPLMLPYSTKLEKYFK